MEFTAKQIAAFIQGRIVGDENATVNTFAKIEEGVPKAISFLANPKYINYIYPRNQSKIFLSLSALAYVCCPRNDFSVKNNWRVDYGQ